MDLSSCGAILTGASRGIGVSIAEALAARGVRLVLAARSERALEEVRDKLIRNGAKVTIMPTDVADLESLERLVTRARADLGSIDLVVNNAGVEYIAYYQELSIADIERTLRVNLFGPMALTRMVLPDMLARDRGHILNIASLAGLGATAFAEPYGASKHGLVGFTRCLRASLQSQGSHVSASVVCPGFVSDAGMYADMNRAVGVVAPAMMGTCTPESVASATVRAIERDTPEVIVNTQPVRPMLVLGSAMPRLAEWIVRALHVNEAFRKVADWRLEQSKALEP